MSTCEMRIVRRVGFKDEKLCYHLKTCNWIENKPPFAMHAADFLPSVRTLHRSGDENLAEELRVSDTHRARYLAFFLNVTH
jgi:hypothetical protein